MPLVMETVKAETACTMGEVRSPHLHYVKPGEPHEGVVVPLDDPRVSAKVRADLVATHPEEYGPEARAPQVAPVAAGNPGKPEKTDEEKAAFKAKMSAAKAAKKKGKH